MNMSCLSKSGPNKASKVRVSLAEQGVTARCVAAESQIDTIETVACVCRVSRNDKNPARKGSLSARIVLGYCRRKSANPGSPGKEDHPLPPR